MKGLSVSPACRDDIPALCRLLAELFAIETDFTADPARQSRGLELLLQDAAGTAVLLVAKEEETIVGMCSVQTLISTAEGGPVGLIEDLVVSQGHRGRGAGTALLAAVTRWCLSRNISRIQLLRDTGNLPAKGFYEQRGWLDTNLLCMRKML